MDETAVEFKKLYDLAQVLWEINKVEEAVQTFEKAVTYIIEETVEDQENYIEKLSNLIFYSAREIKRSRNYQLAVRYFKQLVRLNEHLEDPFKLANSLIDLGRSLAFTEKFQEAYICYERALELLERTYWNKTITFVCGLILDLHIHSPKIMDLQQARVIFEIGLKATQKMARPTYSAGKLHKNIALLFKEKEPKFALSQAVKAAKIYREVGRSLTFNRKFYHASKAFEQAFWAAKIAGDQGLIIQILKELMESIRFNRNPFYLQKFIDEFDQFWDQRDAFSKYQKDLIDLSEIIAQLEYRVFHNIKKAIELLQTARKYHQEQNNTKKQTKILATLSDISRIAGALDQSLKFLMDAENLLEKLDNPDKDEKTTYILKIGHVFRNYGDYQAAASRYEKALRLNPENTKLRSECLLGLSHIASLQSGDYERSLRLSNEAIQLVSNRTGYKMILASIGGLLIRFNAFKEAKEVLDELLMLRKSTKDASVDFRIIGLFNLRLGRYKESLKLLNQSLDLGKKLEKQGFGKKWKLLPQNTLITYFIIQGRFNEAKTLAEESLHLSLQPPIHHAGVVLSHRQLASIALHQENYSDGLEHIHKALKIVEDRNIQFRRAPILEMLSILQYRANQLDEARQSLIEASDIYSGLSNSYFKIRHAQFLARIGNYTLVSKLFQKAADESQFSSIREFYQILSLYFSSCEKQGTSKEFRLLNEAITLCSEFNDSSQEIEILNTFKFWETLLNCRLEGLKRVDEAEDILELNNALQFSKKNVINLLESSPFLSIAERTSVEKALELLQIILEALAQNRLPNESEITEIENIIEKLAFLNPLRFNTKIRILHCLPKKEEAFDKDKIRFFLREILFDPPSMRYPLSPLIYHAYIGDNYD
ncbi:MAG: hypothetical protein ACFFCZ_03140 [Promethearchaeota archaeon]